MTFDEVIFHGQNAVFTILRLAGPLLLTALVIGTIVSVLQSVTQIQEITLVFVPKMVGVFVVLLVVGAWMLDVSVGFGRSMFESIPPP
ncbi:MAG: flagellar biosynthesis protein FliQ [Proteobacteria bacterium]|nr:flagellar biosynthesis protein FliQ [Pseudomonadota bacterium]MCP4919866.1 flagellar biosynthesis protein FliQ [Pseudomonadota bacterium]